MTKLLIPGLLLLLAWGCSTEDNTSAYQYQIPTQTTDGWQTASLSDVGVDEVPLVNLMNFLLDRDDHLIHGLLIVKDNRLVFEEYFPGYEFDYALDVIDFDNNTLDLVYKDFNRDTLHMCSSMTKSVTSLVFGTVLDRGIIQGVNQKMFQFFPEYSDLNIGQKKLITIEHMLTMSTGLPWDDSSAPNYDPLNDEYQLLFQEDPIRFILAMDLIAQPGTQFEYNSGTTTLLGEIARRSSATHFRQLARENLFTPLGINDFLWYSLENKPEITHASGMLYLKPRDMAKIGQLLLNDGLWNGNRIVSSKWISDSLEEVISLPSYYLDEHRAYGYGYLWWLDTYANQTVDAYAAKGWGGQFIVTIPSLNMVVVHTAGGYIEDDMWNVPLMYYDIIEDYILPAVQ